MKKNEKGVVQLLDKQTKGSMMVSVLWMIIGTLLQALPYVFIYWMIKLVLMSHYLEKPLESTLIMTLGVGMIIAVVLGMSALAYGGVKIHKTAYEILCSFRMKVTDHMLKVNLGFFTEHASGKIQKVIGDNIETMEHFLAHMLPNIINGAVLLVVLLSFMFYLNIWLTLAVIVYIILAFALQGAVLGGKNMKSLMNEINTLNTDISVSFNETVHGIEEIKMFQTSERQMKNLSGSIENYLVFAVKFLKKITPIYEGYKAIITSLVPCLFPVVYWILTRDSSHETIINLMMFIIVTPAIYPTILELVEMGSDFLNVNLKMGEINELLDYETIQDVSEPQCPKTYDIKFEGVGFSYDEKPVINDFSLTIPMGSTTALIGASGCGKSTLGYLLMRFFDVDEGQISIGGVPIQSMANTDLMAVISYVSQDVHLFNETVLGNITMGADLSHDTLVAICKKAQCYDLIMSLPDGFETVLGQNGHRLSGGEAQRIGIARALAKDAPILILDEPMASADTENEHLITMALKELSKHKTVIAIAHRLKNIAHADQIVVLDDGSIKEIGDHKTLMSRESIYSYYYKMQQSIDHWHLEKGVEHA